MSITQTICEHIDPSLTPPLHPWSPPCQIFPGLGGRRARIAQTAIDFYFIGLVVERGGIGEGPVRCCSAAKFVGVFKDYLGWAWVFWDEEWDLAVRSPVRAIKSTVLCGHTYNVLKVRGAPALGTQTPTHS